MPILTQSMLLIDCVVIRGTHFKIPHALKRPAAKMRHAMEWFCGMRIVIHSSGGGECVMQQEPLST